MTIITSSLFSKIPAVTHPLYQLHITETSESWRIAMSVATHCINTKTMPQTLPLLKKHLPTILRCDCFNDDNLPFSQELQATELGHLFEHVLLEYLCLTKLNAGYENAEFTGRTSWNWIREQRGNFHIKITKGKKDSLFFAQALAKSTKLLDLLLTQIASDKAICSFPTAN